jgi:uncharacterized protein YgbK (DUF1537 family)
LRIDLQKSLEGEDVIGTAIRFARQYLPDKPIAITTAADNHEIRRLQARYGAGEISSHAEKILAEISRVLVCDLGVRRLIVAGGETSGQVVKALNITTLSVGPYDGQGVPRTVARMPWTLALMLKSGNLGTDTLFEDALHAMARSN